MYRCRFWGHYASPKQYGIAWQVDLNSRFMVLFTRGHFPIHQKASALTFSMLNSLGGHNFDLMVNGFGTVYNLNPIYLDSKAAVAFVVITNLVTASTNLLKASLPPSKTHFSIR